MAMPSVTAAVREKPDSSASGPTTKAAANRNGIVAEPERMRLPMIAVAPRTTPAARPASDPCTTTVSMSRRSTSTVNHTYAITTG